MSASERLIGVGANGERVLLHPIRPSYWANVHGLDKNGGLPLFTESYLPASQEISPARAKLEAQTPPTHRLTERKLSQGTV